MPTVSKWLRCAVLLFACVLLARPLWAEAHDVAPVPRNAETAGTAPLYAGPVAPGQTVPVAVVLRLRDPDGLTDFLRRVSDPRSADYGHYLTPEEFADRFGPTPAEYRSVCHCLRSLGLQVVRAHANRLVVDAQGTPAAMNAAFHVRLANYVDETGRAFYAPDREPCAPESAGSLIASVVGLSTASRRHSELQRLTESPYSATPQVGTGPKGALSPANIRKAYNLSGVSLNGSGQSIAVFELDGYQASDITSYAQYFGLKTPTLVDTYLAGASGAPGPDSDEVTLDIEMLTALAPAASQILVYETVNTDSGTIDGYNKIAEDDQASVVCTCWGLAEPALGAAQTQAEYPIFQEMAAQGQTVVCASGDNGAYDNGPNGGLCVDDPAAQPYVCGVGGTSLTTTTTGGSYLSETTWNDGEGASGGGISANWGNPSWQLPAAKANSQASVAFRNVPDVSLNADPNSGYAIYYQSAWHVYGGCSCAAPLWAAFAALVNQRRVALGEPVIGQIAPALYAIAAGSQYHSDFNDIDDGSSNLYYAATAGYDLATGLGSFSGENLIEDLAGDQWTMGAETFPAGINLISLPYNYSDISPATLFGQPGVRMAVWQPALESYAYSPSGPAASVRLGGGYWVMFDGPVSLTTAGKPAASGAPFDIPLTAGWNQIGDPFTEPVPISSLTVTEGGQSVLFSTAVSDGLIGPDLYLFDVATSAYDSLDGSNRILPCFGYWIYAYGNADLSMSRPQ